MQYVLSFLSLGFRLSSFVFFLRRLAEYPGSENPAFGHLLARGPTLRAQGSVTRRTGLTLLEVILALAIFVGSLAVLSKLVEIGVRASQYTQLQTRAVLLAQSKMGEIVAGVVPTSATGDTFTEDPAWRWQLSSADGPVDGLKWISIGVAPSATGELASNRERIEFTLSRWVLDPAYVASLDQTTE